jgi:hypothetical protein
LRGDVYGLGWNHADRPQTQDHGRPFLLAVSHRPCARARRSAIRRRYLGIVRMELDDDKIDDAVLALLRLTLHDC